MIKRLLNKADSLLPTFRFNSYFSSLLIRHFPPKSYMDHWSVQPFNGQIVRTQTIFDIAFSLKPSYVIETGTYKGTSTVWLAGLARKETITIEIDPLSALDASQRFRENYSRLPIKLIQGDSAMKIREVLSTINPVQNSVLAYLDAHWLEAIPTASEIQALRDWNGSWVAIIDDFMNPFDESYGYDKYENTVIGAKLIENLGNFEIWVSALPSESETGARRGTGYVFSKSALSEMQGFSFENLRQVF